MVCVDKKSNFGNTKMGLVQIHGGYIDDINDKTIMSRPVIFKTFNQCSRKYNYDVLGVLMDFMCNPYFLKTYHWYTMDYHTIKNAFKEYITEQEINRDIQIRGFMADTYHMSRLYDSAVEEDNLMYLSKKFNPLGTIKFEKINIPPREVLEHIDNEEFLSYAAKDAMVTFELSSELKRKLTNATCKLGIYDDAEEVSLWDLYYDSWKPFGQLLVEMEEHGIKINESLVTKHQENTQNDIDRELKKFHQWAGKVCKNGNYMNLSSRAQLGHFFFGQSHQKLELKIPTDNLTENDLNEHQSNEATKKRNYAVKELGSLGIEVISETSTGKPQMTDKILAQLVDKRLSMHFNDENDANEAIDAVQALRNGLALNKQMNTYIEPFKSVHMDKQCRIHSSFNLNTETGRLSSRNPNLQNLPSVKDKLELRKMFIADDNNKLIVGDYAQIELRVLAYLSNCKSMIDAFHIGGDFHSRTAVGMYEYIKNDVDNGIIAIDSNDRTMKNIDVPLVKDKYSKERHNAKTVNFSIAYGKTALGLADDLQILRSEAEDIIRRWYSDRKEVKLWQDEQKFNALQTGLIYSLIGRRRKLFDINEVFGNFHPQFMNELIHYRDTHGNIDNIGKLYGKFIRKYNITTTYYNSDINTFMRKAINTPVQSGAADIVMKGMLNIWENAELNELKYKIILQIHDELILEGPTINVNNAMKIVKECMENPWHGMNDKIKWISDVKNQDNWFDAK